MKTEINNFLMDNQVTIREVQITDLPRFFDHQREPIANQMAAFPSRKRESFYAHWHGILETDTVIARTILYEEEVAGNIMCFERDEEYEVGYWIGKEFWGRGIATSALSKFLKIVRLRPLHAHVANHNIASYRVLSKCGFQQIATYREFSHPLNKMVDWYILRLD